MPPTTPSSFCADELRCKGRESENNDADETRLHGVMKESIAIPGLIEKRKSCGLQTVKL